MNILSHLKLRAKLTLLLGLFVLALVASIGAAASLIHQRMLDDRVDKLRAVVQSTIGIAQSLQNRVTAGQLTREQALAMLRDDIHAVQFDAGEGYVIVQSDVAHTQSMMLANGVDPSSEGKPSTAKDSDGRSVGDLIHDGLNGRTSSVVSYLKPKPGQTVPQLKLSYVARFEPWQADFLAGAYVDDLDAAFHAAVLRLGLIGGAILGVTLLLAWLVNRDITVSFGGLKTAMNRLAKGDMTTVVPGTDRRDRSATWRLRYWCSRIT